MLQQNIWIANIVFHLIPQSIYEVQIWRLNYKVREHASGASLSYWKCPFTFKLGYETKPSKQQCLSIMCHIRDVFFILRSLMCAWRAFPTSFYTTSWTVMVLHETLTWNHVPSSSQQQQKKNSIHCIWPCLWLDHSKAAVSSPLNAKGCHWVMKIHGLLTTINWEHQSSSNLVSWCALELLFVGLLTLTV